MKALRTMASALVVCEAPEACRLPSNAPNGGKSEAHGLLPRLLDVLLTSSDRQVSLAAVEVFGSECRDLLAPYDAPGLPQPLDAGTRLSVAKLTEASVANHGDVNVLLARVVAAQEAGDLWRSHYDDDTGVLGYNGLRGHIVFFLRTTGAEDIPETTSTVTPAELTVVELADRKEPLGDSGGPLGALLGEVLMNGSAIAVVSSAGPPPPCYAETVAALEHANLMQQQIASRAQAEASERIDFAEQRVERLASELEAERHAGDKLRGVVAGEVGGTAFRSAAESLGATTAEAETLRRQQRVLTAENEKLRADLRGLEAQLRELVEKGDDSKRVLVDENETLRAEIRRMARDLESDSGAAAEANAMAEGLKQMTRELAHQLQEVEKLKLSMQQAFHLDSPARPSDTPTLTELRGDGDTVELFSKQMAAMRSELMETMRQEFAGYLAAASSVDTAGTADRPGTAMSIPPQRLTCPRSTSRESTPQDVQAPTSLPMSPDQGLAQVYEPIADAKARAASQTSQWRAQISRDGAAGHGDTEVRPATTTLFTDPLRRNQPRGSQALASPLSAWKWGDDILARTSAPSAAESRSDVVMERVWSVPAIEDPRAALSVHDPRQTTSSSNTTVTVGSASAPAGMRRLVVRPASTTPGQHTLTRTPSRTPPTSVIAPVWCAGDNGVDGAGHARTLTPMVRPPSRSPSATDMRGVSTSSSSSMPPTAANGVVASVMTQGQQSYAYMGERPFLRGSTWSQPTLFGNQSVPVGVGSVLIGANAAVLGMSTLTPPRAVGVRR